MKYHKKIKETILFTITSKRMINLAINLPKEAKDKLWELLKMLMQVTECDTTKRDTPFLEWKNQYC